MRAAGGIIEAGAGGLLWQGQGQGQEDCYGAGAGRDRIQA